MPRLTITPRASHVIRRVTAHPKLAPSSGLRIASRQGRGAPLEVKIVHSPEPGDRVVEHQGGRLFLSTAAVVRVVGRELDAVTDRGGRVQFVARDAT